MIVSEVKNAGITVRFHDDCCQKEPRRAMEEINRIISQAYKRRASFVSPIPLEIIPMRTDRH